MHRSGLQGGTATIFGLNNASASGVQMLTLASHLRLDSCNCMVVLDAAVLVLTLEILPHIRSFLQTLTGRGFCSIKVDDSEMQLWKQALPVFVERCRQWKHRRTCKYLAKPSIPLSTKPSECPLCSCGNGQMLDDVIAGFPELKSASRFAVRVAISPLFPSPFVEQMFMGN